MRVPEPSAVLEAKMRDGACVLVRRHGNPEGFRVLLSHGNGFAIDGYAPFWERLTERCDVLVYDQRNHGQSPYHGAQGHSLDGLVADLDAVIDAVAGRFGERPLFGALHSVSALTAIRHAAERDWRWRGLVLFDPPLVPSPGEALHERAKGSELFLANWAMRREDRFAAPGELAEHFRRTRAMQGWVEGAHELLARAVVRESEGSWTLACPRELEASIYIANAYSDTWERLGELTRHRDTVLLLSGDPAYEHAKYPALVAERVREKLDLHVEAVACTTHMLQIERPKVCADKVLAFLERMEETA